MQPPAARKRRWLIPVIAVACLVVIAAVVLVLVFVVFAGSSGPQATAENMLKAMQNGDADALLALVDMQAFEKAGIADSFEKEVRSNLENSKIVFKGAKFKTAEQGDEATVTVTGGTVSFTDANGKTSTGTIKDDFAEELFLVKKDGKWLLSDANFEEMFAKDDIASADKSLDSLIDDYSELNTSIQTAFKSIGTSATSTQDAAAKFDEQVKKSTAEIDAFIKTAQGVKSDYESAASQDSTGDYEEYINKRLGEVTDLIKIGETYKVFLAETNALVNSWITSPPATGDAASQAVEAISSKYMPELQRLENNFQQLDKEADAMMKELGLQ